MAERAMIFLVENIKNVLVHQKHLITGAENELHLLQKELQLMNSFMEETATTKEKGEEFRQFQRQIREAVYKAEDTLDTCLTQAQNQAQAPAWAPAAKPINSMSVDLRNLRELQIKPIFDMAKTGLTALPTVAQASHISKPPTLMQDNIVGCDDEADTIIRYLKEECEQLDVISIIGMPGSGKTTLARKLYRDRRIRYMFSTSILVYVSQDINLREICLTILKEFNSTNMSSLSDFDLTNKVRARLETSKFVLFMDNVWTAYAWRQIETILPKTNNLGRVVITSQDEKVALQANPRRDPHKLPNPTYDLKQFISLSYSELPHYLRDCFLYLGMFPEDSMIRVWKLMWLWIAEGFIQPNAEKSVEEVAEDYLRELVARKLLMVDKSNARGDVKSCRVHDMIREFCKSEAAKQNLFQEVNMLPNTRRLCVHSSVVEFLEKKQKGPFVRSFLCFSEETIRLPVEYTSYIPEAFDLLRVLDVVPIILPQYPFKLSRLIHLRYINMSGKLDKLPDAFTNFWNLQTIKVNTVSSTFEIKPNIWKMMNLRHLKTKAAIILNKDQEGEAGENLQTLSRLSTKCCTEEVFSKTSNLKNLGIRGDLRSLSDTNCLKKLDCLRKLKLVHDELSGTSHNPLQRLPVAERFPPNIKILNLSSTFLNWNHMTTLGMIPTLEVLKLKENAFVGRCWMADAGSFPSLESLHIARMVYLEIWTAAEGSFPKIKYLVVRNCEKLQEIPTLVQTKLVVLDLTRVHKSIVVSARRLKEEKQGQQGGVERGTFKLLLALVDE